MQVDQSDDQDPITKIERQLIQFTNLLANTTG